MATFQRELTYIRDKEDRDMKPDWEMLGEKWMVWYGTVWCGEERGLGGGIGGSYKEL